MRGKILSLDEAKPLMSGWAFYGGYGVPECYATYIWTNKRVIWISEYDGSTGFHSTQRNPITCIPSISGG